MLPKNNEDKNLNNLNVLPINLPSNFHIPTDYEALCKLLEHNHQHHFKSINEMCYGCDKLNNNNETTYKEQENEDLNEKIEHIQPQNHEHLCSLHALQFYPCLEDNIEVIGELNNYANIEDPDTDLSSTSSTIELLQQQPPNLDLLQQQQQPNISTNDLKQNTGQTSSTPSMYIPSDFNSKTNNNNNSLLISNGHFIDLKNSLNSTKTIIDKLTKSHNENEKTIYNVSLPIETDSNLNQQITNEPVAYTDPMLTTNKILQNEQIMTNLPSTSFEYLLNDNKATTDVTSINSFPSIIADDKLANPLNGIYTKNQSLPVYSGKDLPDTTSILTKDNSSATLATNIEKELSSPSTTVSNSINVTVPPSFNVNNPLLNPSLNPAIPNMNTIPPSTSSNLTYSLPNGTNTFSMTNPIPSMEASSSSVPVITEAITAPTSTATVTTTTISDQSQQLNILPQTKKETKSRFTSVARSVAPPPKPHIHKTYVKNTTIRSKPAAIDPEEKRRRNTEASARFRARKKFTEIMLKQQTHDLSCKCCELEKQVAEAKKEIEGGKQLLIAKQS